MHPIKPVFAQLTLWGLPVAVAAVTAMAPASAQAMRCAGLVEIGQVTSSGGSTPVYTVAIERKASSAVSFNLSFYGFPNSVKIYTTPVGVHFGKSDTRTSIKFGEGKAGSNPPFDISTVKRSYDTAATSASHIKAADCFYPSVRGL